MGACPAELDIKKVNRNMDALYSLTRSVVTKGAMMVGGCILAAAMKIKLGVVASVLLCTAGSVLAGDALDSPSKPPNAWDTMVASEEMIFVLTPQFKALAASLNNLKFPDHLSHELFEGQVTVIDLASADTAAKVQQVANLGIDIPNWMLEQTARNEPLKNLQLWRPFMDRVEYINFPWTEFKAVNGQFLNEQRDSFEINLALQGVGRLKSGGWVWLKTNNVVRWKKQPNTDAKDPEKWKIYDWRTTKFSAMERSDLLFDEVLDVVFSRDDATKAKRSILEELRLDYLLQKDKKTFKEPHKHFSPISHDRHAGVAVVDLDGDGFDDIYYLVDYGKNLFFRNRGDGTFEEIAEKLGLDLEGQSSSAIFADFDNNGHLDVIIGRTLARSIYMRWENGRFVDRSDWISAGQLPYFASSVSVVDYDGDGLLDVYISTYAASMATSVGASFDPDIYTGFLPGEDIDELHRLMKKMDSPYTDLPGPPNVLLRNLGSGKFEIVKDSPLRVFKNTYQTTWSDFDGDGKPDLYLANDFNKPTLFRNLGAGKFADVTEEMGMAEARFGMGATWGDYDNDGRIDLYVSAMSSKAGRRIIAQLPTVSPRLAVMAAGNALYRNLPNSFEKTSGATAPNLQVEQSGWDWGAQFVDLNNDGWLDIFSLSGYYTAPKQIETDFDI